MRVLLVDDDPTAQRVMKLFLEKSGYQAEVQSDGSRVLELAQGPDAPPIIILDWMLPGQDGPSLCRALRSARLHTRPYILMFSSRNSATEIAAALDAGADDFISKPFNVAETQARLRVACRLIEYQLELQRQIDDIEALSQRNSLLGEMMGRKSGPAPAGAAQKTQHMVPRHAKGNPANFSMHEIRFLLSASLIELRLAVESASPVEGLPSESALHLCGWACLVASEPGLWMDLILDARHEEAVKLFQKSLGRDPRTDNETAVYFAEVVRTIAQGISRTLAIRAGEVVMPLMSRGRLAQPRAIPLPLECQSYHVKVDSTNLRLTLAVQGQSKLKLAAADLREADILADQYPPREVSEVPLFKPGTTLTPRFIERIAYNSEGLSEENHATIFRPSRLARFFEHGAA